MRHLRWGEQRQAVCLDVEPIELPRVSGPELRRAAQDVAGSDLCPACALLLRRELGADADEALAAGKRAGLRDALVAQGYGAIAGA